MKNKAPTALVILDGFGFCKETEYNAIAKAHTPCFDELLTTYPATLLKASGTAVGLPEGSIGNSEVGHLTIGSGSIVLQPYTIIHEAIRDKSFFKNQILIKHLKQLKEKGGALHIMGLLSDATVHSHIENLFAFLTAAKEQGLTDIVVHPFLDGRDVLPQSAAVYLEKLEAFLKDLKIGIIGSLHGRFYAMDRNNHWNLTERSYNVLTKIQLTEKTTWQIVLKNAYDKSITDEFIEPIQLCPQGIIKPYDGIIFFNFRPDRARQLTAAFINQPADFNSKPLHLSFFITPVSYGPEYLTTFLYNKSQITQTLNKILHKLGYSIFTIAEAEKYAHVTYFFNGGQEGTLPNEKRVFVPSLSDKKYDQHPEMSAPTITEAIIDSLKHDMRDFYVINYANADMVGHSGNFQATVKAIECLDKQLQTLYTEIVQKHNGTLYITADHGKAEVMFDTQTNQPLTSHTANPVFFLMIAQALKDRSDELPLEELADIAPFIVHNITE
jgi:2,3-bisphosphoglycerate-independent phosphoglycerate mutase